MNKINVELIKYSECEETSKRIATFLVTMPKFIQTHINSHRSLSKNSASSRAIPARKLRYQVLWNPFIPVFFGNNKPGMQSGTSLKGFKLFLAKQVWLLSRLWPVFLHFIGEKINLHKETLNRIIEPWIITEVLITATEWKNFIQLRNNEMAQPEIKIVAEEISKLLKNNLPNKLKVGEWHMPFLIKEDLNLSLEKQKMISTARSARVSYFLSSIKTSDIEKDIKLCERLSSSGHWSPFEHVAQAQNNEERFGNFVGWKQYRKEFEGESGGDFSSN